MLILEKHRYLTKYVELVYKEEKLVVITQHIGASFLPVETIEKICGQLYEKLSKVEHKIPGILVIDTPGHEIFTNLRSRGGSAADIAILVVDVNRGFQPQN